jgi:hypothetical protein
MRDAIRKLSNHYQDILSYLLSGLGLAFYAQQSWVLIHTLASNVYDESGYMARGFLIASGRYWPYEDYGLPLDHMPLSFTIPGYIQVLFGPGIRTGRYFSFTLGLVALIGLWIAARKLGGKWWAAIAVWSLALNPGWIESHSLGYSQVLILFLTTWSFVFAIGENKKNWEIILASFLAGLAGMTRLNLMPVVFLLILFFYWQHGKKAGNLSLIGGLTPIVFLHILFWPGILKMWAYYVPEGIIPLIDTYRLPKIRFPEDFSFLLSSGWMNNPKHLMWEVIQFFWKGLLKNLFVITGVLASIILWPKKKAWKTEYHRRLAIFFLTTYVILFLMHMWAALSGTSCGFTCFKGYLMFFSNIGIFLIILTFPYWEKNISLWRNIFIGVFISYFLIELEHRNPGWQRNILDVVQEAVKVKVPRLNNPGVIQIWRAVEGIFGIPQKSLNQFLYTFIYWTMPLSFVWVFIPLFIRGFRKLKISFTQFGWILFTTLLFLAGILSPLSSIGGELNTKKCESDVLNSHEAVGETLRAKIPAGSKVYWAMKSWMMVLYLPDIEIYPPQTMIHYTFLHSNREYDQDFILRSGYWNDVLKEEWIHEADYVLVEGRYYNPEWKLRVDSDELEIIDITASVEECRGDDSKILIFQNK